MPVFQFSLFRKYIRIFFLTVLLWESLFLVVALWKCITRLSGKERLLLVLVLLFHICWFFLKYIYIQLCYVIAFISLVCAHRGLCWPVHSPVHRLHSDWQGVEIIHVSVWLGTFCKFALYTVPLICFIVKNAGKIS